MIGTGFVLKTRQNTNAIKTFKILLILTTFTIVGGFVTAKILLSSKVLLHHETKEITVAAETEEKKLEEAVTENKKSEKKIKKTKQKLSQKEKRIKKLEELLEHYEKQLFPLFSTEKQRLVAEKAKLENELSKTQADADIGSVSALRLEKKKLEEAQEEFQKAKDVKEKTLNTLIQLLEKRNNFLGKSENTDLQRVTKLQEESVALKNTIVELSDQVDSQQISNQILGEDLKKQTVRLTKLVEKQKNQLEDMKQKNTALIASFSIVPLLIALAAAFVAYSVVKKKKKKKKKRS